MEFNSEFAIIIIDVETFILAHKTVGNYVNIDLKYSASDF